MRRPKPTIWMHRPTEVGQRMMLPVNDTRAYQYTCAPPGHPSAMECVHTVWDCPIAIRSARTDSTLSGIDIPTVRMFFAVAGARLIHSFPTVRNVSQRRSNPFAE